MTATFPLDLNSTLAGILGAGVVGVAFGFFLERAGLGNARKLTGQFYGTDFTVFKVMFTAIATAMLGVFWFTRMGWLDLGSIYFVPTRFWPQLVGGLIFGAGFVVGGYCPGTSCVAAATGRGDALLLMLGILAGLILLDVAGDPILAWIQSFEPRVVTLPTLLGVPRGVVIVGVVGVAIFGCTLATRLERHG